MTREESINDLVKEYKDWSDEQLVTAFSQEEEYSEIAFEAMSRVASKRKIQLPKRRKKKLIEEDSPDSSWLHIPLGILGAYNAYRFIAYYFELWGALNEQGISNLYLIIAALLGSWWNLLAFFLCFSGNKVIFGEEDKPFSKLLLGALLGAVMSLIIPVLMQTGFALLITWLHTVLF